MKVVHINVSKLLGIIKENRKKHIAEYEEAMAGYRVAAVKKLKELIKSVQANEEISPVIGLVMPINNASEYDRTIRMLELSDSDVVEITDQEFKMYVMDDWQWTQQFKLFANTYNGK